MDELDKFLKFLYESETGYVYSPLKLKTGEWVQKYFQWPSQKEELKDWITLSSPDGNVYVAPALFETKSAKKENVKLSNVAWVEFDGQKPPEFNGIPKPDVIIQTSVESHTHCYWKIERTSDYRVLEDINRRLTYHLSADGSGWDSTQVLRPPGTTNWKHNLPVTVSHFKPPILRHKLPAFDGAPEVSKPPLLLTYEDLEDSSAIISKHSFPTELETMVLRGVAAHGDRSTYLMRAGYLLAAANCSEEEIVSLLYHMDSRLKKFVGRSDQLLRLAEIAALAVLDLTKILHIEGFSPREILSNEQQLEWIVEGWLHRNGIMLVSGAPGVGKTQLVLDFAYRLCTGSSILGKPPVSPVSVGFLSLEMEIVELKYIFQHHYEAWHEDKYDLFDANFRAFAPDEERSLAAYEKILANHKPKVFIIDSLSELAEDDLKESEARIIMSWVRKMRKEHDCAIILIHHNRKASDGNKRPRKLSDLYGSYIFGKLSETVISLWDLEKDNELDIDSFKVRFGNRIPLRVKRTENLTFEKTEIKINVSRQSREAAIPNPLLEGILKITGSD